MTDRDDRPTADEMLARTAGDPDTQGGRGRLRVYLGMAPGVGKTYRMLEEGHRRIERGTDLVVGFVETHGRPGTAALIDGLEVVPRRRVEYRGVVVEEMDTDAVIARRPEVALIDELAHTNAPGSARAKRWQDIEAILEAGIDVVSTCNIQHLESAADAVATITGAPVNERIPDEVLARASEIELVDMSPHALRQRMRHGNVYPPERTAVALDRFFTESNLTALREQSLRFVAGRVDAQLETIGGGTGASALTERILVYVDDAPSTPRALRRGAAMAASLRAPFLALVVDAPSTASSGSRDRQRDLREHLDDAVDLGAEVVYVEADDPVEAILRVARDRRISQIVLPYRPTGSVERFRKGTVVDRLLTALPDVEVHVVAAARGVSDAYRVGRGD